MLKDSTESMYERLLVGFEFAIVDRWYDNCFFGTCRFKRIVYHSTETFKSACYLKIIYLFLLRFTACKT